jgi:cell division protein FtsI/penicillin-binding protein 2
MDELDRPHTPPDFFKRLQIISAFFCALAVIFVLRLCTTAVIKSAEREKILERLRVATTLKIPGCRGKILDRQGNILAWTERQMELVWHVPQNYSQAEFEWAELIRFNSFVPSMPHITRLTDYLGQDIKLCSNQPFSTPEIWNAIQLVSEHLECHATFKRCYSNPDLKQMIGETAVNPENNIEEGISGLELEYDRQLRAGLFEIQLLNNSYRAILLGDKADGDDIRLNAIYVF